MLTVSTMSYDDVPQLVINIDGLSQSCVFQPVDDEDVWKQIMASGQDGVDENLEPNSVPGSNTVVFPQEFTDKVQNNDDRGRDTKLDKPANPRSLSPHASYSRTHLYSDYASPIDGATACQPVIKLDDYLHTDALQLEMAGHEVTSCRSKTPEPSYGNVLSDIPLPNLTTRVKETFNLLYRQSSAAVYSISGQLRMDDGEDAAVDKETVPTESKSTLLSNIEVETPDSTTAASIYDLGFNGITENSTHISQRNLAGVDDNSAVMVGNHGVPVCDQCSYISHGQGDLRRHLRKHTSDKPYACPVPGCTFRTRYYCNVEYHLPVHSDERRFACDRCEAKFKFKSQLCAHRKTHMETEVELNCGMCYGRLMREVGTRASDDKGNRTFVCDLCGYMNEITWNLQRWIYKCYICGHTYKDKNALLHHWRHTHQKARRVLCVVCQIDFANRSSLRNHMRLHSPADNLRLSGRIRGPSANNPSIVAALSTENHVTAGGKTSTSMTSKSDTTLSSGKNALKSRSGR